MSLEYVAVWDARLVVFDLEWVGNLQRNVNETRIFAIGAVHPATRRTLSVVVDPGVSAQRLRRYETFAGCRRLTRAWLKRHHAVPFARAFEQLRVFVTECVTRCAGAAPRAGNAGSAAILVAHGCHRADLPVLASALRKCGVTPPPLWRFMDSLLFFRRVLHPPPAQFTLPAVAAALGVPPGTTGRAHDALPDALLLHLCLMRCASHVYGALYNVWQTPLTTIPGVGLRNQTLLLRYGALRSVEDVLNFAQRAQGAARGAAARARLVAAFVQFGLQGGAATRVARWCADALVLFDEIAAEYK